MKARTWRRLGLCLGLAGVVLVVLVCVKVWRVAAYGSVLIHNESGAALRDIRIRLAGHTREWDVLVPVLAENSSRFLSSRETDLIVQEVAFELRGTEISQNIDALSTRGETSVLTVSPDGSVRSELKMFPDQLPYVFRVR